MTVESVRALQLTPRLLVLWTVGKGRVRIFSLQAARHFGDFLIVKPSLQRWLMLWRHSLKSTGGMKRRRMVRLMPQRQGQVY